MEQAFSDGPNPISFGFICSPDFLVTWRCDLRHAGYDAERIVAAVHQRMPVGSGKDRSGVNDYDGSGNSTHLDRGKLAFGPPERWQSGRMRRFAKPLYGLTPVPRVRIPPSPPD